MSTTLTAAEIAAREALAAAVRDIDSASLLVPPADVAMAQVLGAVLAAVGELASVQSTMLARQAAHGQALARLVEYEQATLPVEVVVMT